MIWSIWKMFFEQCDLVSDWNVALLFGQIDGVYGLSAIDELLNDYIGRATSPHILINGKMHSALIRIIPTIFQPGNISLDIKSH